VGAFFLVDSLGDTIEPAAISTTRNQVIMNSIIIVSTTLESREEAEHLARMLVDAKLVACAQVAGPITSFYRWQGEVEAATEFTLSLKTTKELALDLEARLQELHPYELPEIITNELDGVNDAYRNWVCGNVEK
jgi:periplasmic divalent cation tolerance protein